MLTKNFLLPALFLVNFSIVGNSFEKNCLKILRQGLVVACFTLYFVLLFPLFCCLLMKLLYLVAI